MVVLTETTVAGRYIKVIIVSTLTAVESWVVFSARRRIMTFSFLASSASCFKEDPLPRSNIFDSYSRSANFLDAKCELYASRG